jgi:hypothetical protein
MNKQRAGSTDNEQVLKAAVAEIGKQGAGGVVEHSHSGLLGDILERAITAVAIKAVGKARGLADDKGRRSRRYRNHPPPRRCC